MSFCTECGTPHETGQGFCANCGAELGGVITETTWRGPVARARAPVSGLSVVSFVVGLVSVFGAPVLFFLILYGTWIVGGVAIFLGIFAHRKAQERGWERGDVLASAGIVLGIIGSILQPLLLLSLHPWSP